MEDQTSWLEAQEDRKQLEKEKGRRSADDERQPHNQDGRLSLK